MVQSFNTGRLCDHCGAILTVHLGEQACAYNVRTTCNSECTRATKPIRDAEAKAIRNLIRSNWDSYHEYFQQALKARSVAVPGVIVNHDEDISHGTPDGWWECRRQIRGACDECRHAVSDLIVNGDLLNRDAS